MLFEQNLTQQEIEVKYRDLTTHKVSFHTLKRQFDKLTRIVVKTNKTQPESTKNLANLNNPALFRNLADSVILASCHQGQEIFGEDGQGRQCTAMSVTALIFGYMYDCNSWTMDTLNEVLLRGNEHYLQCCDRIGAQRYLTTEEAVGEIEIFGRLFQISLPNIFPTEYGQNINSRQGQIQIDFEMHVNEFMVSAYRFGILTTNGYTFGLIKQDNFIHMFDSHARNEAGLTIENGEASIRKFSIVNFLQYIHIQFKDWYEFYYAEINLINSIDRVVDPEAEGEFFKIN